MVSHSYEPAQGRLKVHKFTYVVHILRINTENSTTFWCL